MGIRVISVKILISLLKTYFQPHFGRLPNTKDVKMSYFCMILTLLLMIASTYAKLDKCYPDVDCPPGQQRCYGFYGGPLPEGFDMCMTCHVDEYYVMTCYPGPG